MTTLSFPHPFFRHHSWFEATARARLALLLDPATFVEFLPPEQSSASPHLAKLDIPGAFDDGAIVGSGLLAGNNVLVIAQEGHFMGGAVGEIHGAKIVGLLRRALVEKPSAVLFLVDSGGVRLHEANAGLIAISEIMRALLAVRAAGIPVVALVGGSCGAFGGMGIVTCLCSAIIISEEGRLALSGPEVIETVAGVEEFDSKDRALVWRVTGGKHRYLMGDCVALTEDDIAAFREAVIEVVEGWVEVPSEVASLRAKHQLLSARLKRFGSYRDGLQVWAELGVPEPTKVSMLDRDRLVQIKQNLPASPPAAGESPASTRAPCAPSELLAATLDALFPGGHQVTVDDKVVVGQAQSALGTVAVLGTIDAAEIDHRIALALAGAVLDVIENHPQRPIVFLVDTAGQALSRRDELLCLNGSFAYLAECVDLARRKGHSVVSMVIANAVSGGFLSFGLMADQVYALEGSRVRVIHLKAMARVTKIEHTRLVELSASSPIFAPGPENYRQMGAIEAIWEAPSAALIDAALARGALPVDTRMQAGLARGGRVLADSVAKTVENAPG